MKLRIRGNSIRFRLTQSEVEKVKETGLVEEETDFPNGQNFVYLIKVADNFSTEFVGGKMSVLVPTEIANNWANSDQVGIYETINNLQIVIEKDFNCLTPRAGDEDKDTFPHPTKSHNC
jgi:hypothetical protein